MTMSAISQPMLPLANFLTDEERWFAERERDKKRPTRSSPTMPPPPIGDALADRWFR